MTHSAQQWTAKPQHLTAPPPPPPVVPSHSTHGGVPKFSFEEAKNCRCDDAYEYNCRDKTYANYGGPGDLVCPRWTTMSLIAGQLALNTVDYFVEHENEVKGHMVVGAQELSGSVTVLGIGLHEALDARRIIEKVIKPMIEHADERGGDSRIICLLLPAPDMKKKPEAWKGSQGTKPVSDFNELIRRYCKDHGAEVFEMWAPTVDASSYDGTHFAVAGNALMGQLFLNTLAHGKGWEKASKAFSA
jgi:hypothetical protein